MSFGRRRGIAATIVFAVAFGTPLLALPTPARAATLAALYQMNETSGSTMFDASGNGHDGSLSNVAFTSPGFDGSGGAYVFNGSTSKVVVPNAASLNPGTQDVTITARVKFTVLPPTVDYDMVRKKGNRTMYRMEIWETGQAYCSFKGSNMGVSVRQGPNIANGQWHTIVCRKTSTAVFLTVDGATWSKSGSAGSISSTADLLIGHKAEAPYDLYNGVLDEVSIEFGGGLAPTITSFTPTSGPVGTTVTISGTAFTGATDVRFNGTSAGVGNFTVDSDAQITAVVPGGATSGPISVTIPSGTGTSSTSFTVTGGGTAPTITSFTPTSGPVGTTVTITGTNFSGATVVKFGGVAATFTIDSNTQIVATVPPGAATGKIVVKTPAGKASSPTKFTVV